VRTALLAIMGFAAAAVVLKVALDAYFVVWVPESEDGDP
jgi:hypothetical protein